MRKETLKQQAYNIIKKKIITCEYPPNFLLNEEKLKDEIGASRTPIRDALSRLEQENLVRILPKKGIMVASLSIREINAIYEARMLVEPYAIEHYANKVEKERLEYFRKFRDGKEIQERIYDVDDKLHIEFINAMDNEYFQAMYERIYYQNCRLRILSGVKSEKRIEETLQEHLKIINACLEEQWQDAAEAMREHLVCSKRASFMTIIESGEMAL
uniref:GntR family transcriptional regulator n=1 Tax=Mediterraneibacter glycyrrhizinilyticus TaxID=342942 RepID=UPI0006D1C9D5